MSVTIITLNRFLQEIEAIAALNPTYRSGGSGTDGTCDCIGLIIGAIRRSGGKWPGLHGSNYAARNEMADLAVISSAHDLTVGELVFKHHAPGETGYDLPSRYKGGKDLNDYYHVGIVTSVAPLRIHHMTSPRMQVDTALGKWSHHGWCRRVAPGLSMAASPSTITKDTGSLPGESIARILAAMAQIETQLDAVYEILGGRG